MNKDEAIRRATEYVMRNGGGVKNDPPTAMYKERNMRLGDDRSGWVVFFRLDFPEGFEPDSLHVEVYEPDGEIHVPRHL